MSPFLAHWGEAAFTSLGFFWMALWAFALGYLVSSLIQVFVTRERMKEAMGNTGPKEVGLGAFFGFISSSCSFAALATTKALIKKGAGFVPSLAFLLASTNLVIELGIVIAIFLSWQYVVGEYVGGLLLILITWLFVWLTNPRKLIEQVRERFGKGDSGDGPPPEDLSERAQKADAWNKVGRKYWSEWQMVWKDVTIGFTVAGVIAAFVPPSFFETLFIGTGGGQSTYSFFQLLEHALVGPVVAFITFIGSMGNIPLAAVLYSNGVSFAGIMAFIFSDLVVFPVLRINAKYYGWRMALYILLALLTALVGSSLILHYGFSLFDALPELETGRGILDRTFFALDYTFFLNVAFLAVSGLMWWLSTRTIRDQRYKGMGEMASKGSTLEGVLTVLAYISYAWLGIGLFIHMAL